MFDKLFQSKRNNRSITAHIFRGKIHIMSNDSLQRFSTDELADELASRKDLETRGEFSDAVYKLNVELGVMACVDGVAVRKRDGVIEALAIRRNTGPFKGKLCSVGGRIRSEESFEQAIRRHFKTDLNTEIKLLSPWDDPVAVHQLMRPRPDGTVLPDFGSEPRRRHAITIVYLVRLRGEDFTFGSTPYGGQEAESVEWFSLKDMPPPSEFGYGQDAYFRKCLIRAETIL